ncbi:MAG: RDD family protein [Pseudomonadota bacterium]
MSMAEPGIKTDRFKTSEGVELDFEIAALAMRFTAQLWDLLVTVIPVIALAIILAQSDLLDRQSFNGFFALAFFLIRTPYYALTELFWNGTTVGKRIVGIRVVSADGQSLTPHQIWVRNLMREAEVLVPITILIAGFGGGAISNIINLVWVLMVFAVPLFNKRNRRLGDLAARTLVIVQPKAALLPELSVRGSRSRFEFTLDQLDHYGAYELQVLEEVLQSERPIGHAARKQQAERRARIAERIRERIGFEAQVDKADIEAFLEAFYARQRAHLEERQLLGDRRADKRYRDET